jgi:signal transduction histidine kinase
MYGKENSEEKELMGGEPENNEPEHEELDHLKEMDLDKAIDIISKQNDELKELRKDMKAQRNRLEKIYNKMRTRTIDLFGRMVDLKKAKRTISLQNEQLETQRYEIEHQRQSLEKTYKKFRERTIDLFGKMVDLKKAKKTIVLQNQELKKQRQKLDEINATKDKFFSIIAHDLKNPIAGFLELTDLLTENYDELSHNESKELISLMNKNSKHLFALLENLLHWSRAQTGNISFSPQLFKLNIAVDETVSLLKMNMESKKVVLINKIPDSLMVKADFNMLNTVLRNLISNAVKFSHPQKTIELGAKETDNHIEVFIKDQGVGVPESDQEKLFSIGHNIARNGTANEKGTGLGLLVCKEFIERHQGEIWLESKENQGTTFYFTLPNKD